MKKSTLTKHSANNIKCWDCKRDATEKLKEMFVEFGQKHSIEKGSKPARRAVFRKQHGIAYGQFIINQDINKHFKIGIFDGNHYDCVVRFSSDTAPNAPDLHSTLGVGLKLFGVSGENLLGESNNADFIFQNIDHFFASDAKQMCEFTTAGAIDHNYPSYLKHHPKVAEILDEMQKIEASCLTASYWAILPFKLGNHQIVKYRLVPDKTTGGAPFDNLNYLGYDLQNRLRNDSAKFRFEVQLRTDNNMPIDDAQSVWSTQKSPYICIAELHLPKQDICAIGQEEFGENLAFNIWRTLPAHEPLGSIADARKVVYKASAKARHQANGQQLYEPEKINPPFKDNEDDTSDCIVYAGIYPPIGVMRVGNSKEAYFIGPEVDNPIARADKNAYRDTSGKLKRQAAKFRIYGFNAAGKAVKELTLNNAEIEWEVHLANQKASWYEFQLALDIPEAAHAPPSLLRNNDIADRTKLLIDGGGHKISDKNTKDHSKFSFVGRFMDDEVYLGEMQTDEDGRLIMLGGHGVSKNVKGDMAVTFANNEGWYDDIADGPVKAKVKLNGVELRVEPAWVISAPPDFAPMQKSTRTMWDLMRDVAIQSGTLKRPARPSFKNDILPIFQRMTDLQWVNAGFAAAFGWGGQFNFTTLEWLKKLSNPSSSFYELRKTINNNFRRYDAAGATAPQLWPWIYGDAMNIPPTDSVRQNATLSELQLSFLAQWVEGDFEADYDPDNLSTHPQEIEDLPINQQPDMLTKASMDFCLADAFHPGCEMTWPMRTPDMYISPFRIKHAKKTEPTNGHYYGPLLNNSVITLPKGPLMGGQTAGAITRWMAIPWQCDTASCRDGYEPQYDPYVPTFWPARVPNNILSQAMYDKTIDRSLSEQERLQSFAYRTAWLDDLPIDEPVTYTKQINSMIDHFDKLAIVQVQSGVENDTQFPPMMQVGLTKDQSKKTSSIKPLNDDGSMHGETHHRKVDLSNIELVRRLSPRR